MIQSTIQGAIQASRGRWGSALHGGMEFVKLEAPQRALPPDVSNLDLAERPGFSALCDLLARKKAEREKDALAKRKAAAGTVKADNA